MSWCGVVCGVVGCAVLWGVRCCGVCGVVGCGVCGVVGCAVLCGVLWGVLRVVLLYCVWCSCIACGGVVLHVWRSVLRSPSCAACVRCTSCVASSVPSVLCCALYAVCCLYIIVCYVTRFILCSGVSFIGVSCVV